MTEDTVPRHVYEAEVAARQQAEHERDAYKGLFLEYRGHCDRQVETVLNARRGWSQINEELRLCAEEFTKLAKVAKKLDIDLPAVLERRTDAGE